MSKILITGNLGFIGSHLADRLIEDHKVVGIDDLSGGNMENHHPKVHHYLIDCRNPEQVEEIFKQEKPDIVYHLAANAAEAKSVFSPIDITSRNYSAFINTLTPFIKYGGKKFIFTSSIAVYGALQTPFKEIDDPKPEDLYGITKLAAEQTLKVMSEVHGFEYTIARPHNVYGPRQNMTDPYRNVMTIWMNSVLKGKPYYIYGDGSMKRCFSYIDDVVDALVKCKDVNGIFNVGADKSYTLNELSDILQKVVGREYKPVYLEDRVNEVWEAISDHSQAKKLLGYEDKTSLLEGMYKTWDWVKRQGYQEPIYTDFEIESPKIPLNWRTHL